MIFGVFCHQIGLRSSLLTVTGWKHPMTTPFLILEAVCNFASGIFRILNIHPRSSKIRS